MSNSKLLACRLADEKYVHELGAAIFECSTEASEVFEYLLSERTQLDELRAENARYRIALRRIAGPDGFRNNNPYDSMNIAAKALGGTNADP